MLQLLSDPQTWITLLTLSTLEIVLGVDNLVFVSIAVSKLPYAQRDVARKFGIAAACVTRIVLLLTLAYLAGMTRDVFAFAGVGFSVRDLILIAGGLFLVIKGAREIGDLVRGEGDAEDVETRPMTMFWGVIAQIAVIDIVFSLDSVITAVGMAQQRVVMVAAILLSVAVMLWASTPIGRFIDRNPTVKMLALAFIVLVGVFLVAEGLDLHPSKNGVYFAMGFSVAVESLNLWAKRRAERRALPE